MNEHIIQLPLFTTCSQDPDIEIPFDRCNCGCGKKTNVAAKNDRRYGDIKNFPREFLRSHRLRQPIKDRFWNYVAVGAADECWEWQGTLNWDGYGHIASNGHVERAHRVSWGLHVGPIPEGMHVLHSCDNPGCVNPKHLFLGTDSDNSNDKVAKNRQSRLKGERNPGAKVSAAQVREIRRLVKAGRSQVDIAKQLHMSSKHVHRIVRRKNWQHIE